MSSRAKKLYLTNYDSLPCSKKHILATTLHTLDYI